MIKHVILWKIREDKSEEEKKQIKIGVKSGLEGLRGVVPGLQNISVVTEGLPSSNADIMLDSEFESEEALKNYAVHPAHVKVADENVRPFMEVRMCMDFEV